MKPLSRTCLYYSHVIIGARMQPFAGFSMPIQYSGIEEEHKAVRERAGMFDVSHMGEFLISGKESAEFMDRIFSNDVSVMPEGKVQYGMMLNHNGGVVDDLLVYRLYGGKGFLMVVNAANIEKDFSWVETQIAGYDATAENCSDEWSEIALQGPDAERLMSGVLGLDLSPLAFYTFEDIKWEGYGLVVSRTGYTGEDGFEIYASPEAVCRIWKVFLDAGVQPCGLGCRDTLRFEAGLPLYGHELSEDISPLEAGLGVFVKTAKEGFIGREAIVSQKENGVRRKLVGITLDDKAIPRAGYPVFSNGVLAGYVTTGYRSISTGRSVCFALVSADYSAIGTEVEVEIRNKRFRGAVCRKRFYETRYKK